MPRKEKTGSSEAKEAEDEGSAVLRDPTSLITFAHPHGTVVGQSGQISLRGMFDAAQGTTGGDYLG